MKYAIAALALTLGACTTTGGGSPMASIQAAVVDSARPAADSERDIHRKPAEIVAFAGVRPGNTIAEFIPGGGYYTRILAKAVGPKGHIFAIVSKAAAARPGGLDAINAIAATYGNITIVPVDMAGFTLPRQVDLAWTTENYHDLHNGPTANPPAFDRAVFAAVKPGGIFFVEDHSAPGTGTSATSTLHRIDPAAVIAELTGAGFRLEAQSDLLANPADPHTVRSTDTSIRGETDKFALRFRKPR